MDTSQRRKKMEAYAKGSALVVFSGREGALKKFRAQSNFYYLSGFNEPDSVAVFRPGHAQPFVLFLRPRDPLAELWDGKRLGVENATAELSCDAAFAIGDLSQELPKLLADVSKVYYRSGEDLEIDRIFGESLEGARQRYRRSGRGVLPVYDPVDVLGEMRVLKGADEVAQLRKAAAASIEGHRRAMAAAKPGYNEVQIYGQLVSGFYEKCADGEGYSAIVGSGANATVLHYRDNNRTMKDGELLLIDAGAEYQFYTADITRTFPVNGRFSGPQKDLYQAVLETQESLIQSAQVGVTSLSELQQQAARELSQKMADLQLIKESADGIFDQGLYKKYYPHGVGHYLGSDVHDVGRSSRDGKPRKLEAGMVITIEPGLYIPEDDESVPKEFRGMGIRIEDDIHITDKGPENLTADLAKSVADIETCCLA